MEELIEMIRKSLKKIEMFNQRFSELSRLRSLGTTADITRKYIRDHQKLVETLVFSVETSPDEVKNRIYSETDWNRVIDEYCSLVGTKEKSDSELFEDINQTLNKMREDGIFDKEEA